MPEDIKESCGLAAVCLNKKSSSVNASNYLYKMLLQQQNRGQLSAGITTFNPERPKILETFRDIGKVNEVFRASHPGKFDAIMEKLDGNSGIGHVRYATCGTEDEEYAMPFERAHGRKSKWFSFAFNGNLANFSELKKELSEAGYHLVRNVDSEVIMHFLSKELSKDKIQDWKKIFSEISKKFDGAFNLVVLNAEGDLVAMRDPIGFKPLCYSQTSEGLFIASESSGLPANCEEITDIQPGEMLIAMNDGGIEKKRFADCKSKAHCMFEWVYFANVSSVLDKKSVYEVRMSLGKNLAKLETQKIDSDSIVVPVPDAATPAGTGFAFELGMPLREGLIRNRYVGRTFIEGNNRLERVKEKYAVLKTVLEGKKVFLVEDSIVRGTTTANIVERIKKEGKAKEVHVRISCPPIMFPCFYGIDMSSLSELIAPKYCLDNDFFDEKQKTEIEKKIANQISADSVIYQTIDGLVDSIGLPKNELCLACLNGDYPTEAGKKMKSKAILDFKGNKKQRAYE